MEIHKTVEEDRDPNEEITISVQKKQIKLNGVTVGFSYLSKRETGDPDCVKTKRLWRYLREEIRLKGALAGTEEPLHSWLPGCNHELDDRNSNKSTWFQEQFNSA